MKKILFNPWFPPVAFAGSGVVHLFMGNWAIAFCLIAVAAAMAVVGPLGGADDA